MDLTLLGIRKRFPGVHQVSTSTLSQWLNTSTGSKEEERVAVSADNANEVHKPVVLLDSRPPEEYAISHLQDAVQVTPGTTDDQLLTLLHSKLQDGSRVVCYCSLGYRSCVMADRIQSHLKQVSHSGVEVFNLEGSVFKWANEGRPLVDENNQSTRFVHPYSVIWGKLLNRDRRKYPS